MEISLWRFRIVAEYEPFTLKAAIRKERQLGLLHAVKLARERRPKWSLKEAVDYVKSVTGEATDGRG